ncbi:hypothetical protein ACTTAF_03035 [Rhodobacter capsulatus]|uniref:hypothetical protein n=1 Tax=Rhodobacter capsulatus TaxID=1061 RepID=UPI004038BE70
MRPGAVQKIRAFVQPRRDDHPPRLGDLAGDALAHRIDAAAFLFRGQPEALMNEDLAAAAVHQRHRAPLHPHFTAHRLQDHAQALARVGGLRNHRVQPVKRRQQVHPAFAGEALAEFVLGTGLPKLECLDLIIAEHDRLRYIVIPYNDRLRRTRTPIQGRRPPLCADAGKNPAPARYSGKPAPPEGALGMVRRGVAFCGNQSYD